MQLTITITIPDSKSYDIRLDDGQHIVTTLQVLGESIQGMQWLTHGVEVRVKDTGRTLNVYRSRTYPAAGRVKEKRWRRMN